MNTLIKKARRSYRKNVVHRWWSFDNWRQGYKFGPVQRFRCCDHTTPVHYGDCEVSS